MRLDNVHGEHDNLGRHSGHFIAKTVLVDAVGVRGERVLAVGLAIALVDDLVVGSGDEHVDVEEAALDDLEREAELGARQRSIEVALLGVRVHGDEIRLARSD